MPWKWWKPKDDPLKNKYVHELEESVKAIDDETDNRETEYEDLNVSGKRSILFSFLGIGETLKDIEQEDELNTAELPTDIQRKWRELRNRIAHQPLEVQEDDVYVQEHIDDLEELDQQIHQYWLENVEEEQFEGLEEED